MKLASLFFARKQSTHKVFILVSAPNLWAIARSASYESKPETKETTHAVLCHHGRSMAFHKDFKALCFYPHQTS